MNAVIRRLSIRHVLVAVILLGVFMRFSHLEAPYLNGDEEFYIVAAEKFHAGSDYDVRLWNYHAPPVAKYLMSLALVTSTADFSVPYAIPPNLWVYNYLAHQSIKEVYVPLRAVSAVLGVVLIFSLFLIGRELFGTTAGLWAAASAAIAIDYIMLSRLVMVDIFLYAFIALTMLFYIRYRKTGSSINLLGLFISLILMFGSKNAQWIVIIPPLLYTEIVGNRTRLLKTANFLALLGVAWFIHSSFIYPPEISKLADEFFRSGANKNIIEPHLDVVARSLVSINSPLFLATVAAAIALYVSRLGLLERRFQMESVKRHLLQPTPHTFLLLVALASVAVFSLTSLSINSKYVGQTSLPLFVLGGFAVTRLWSRRPLRTAFLALLLLGGFNAVWYAPSYESYPGQDVISFSRPGKTVSPLLDVLDERGNPPVITNELNLLLFYSGQSFPIPPAEGQGCSEGLREELKASGVAGIFKNVGDVEKQFLCRFIFEYSQEIPLPAELQGIRAVVY